VSNFERIKNKHTAMHAAARVHKNSKLKEKGTCDIKDNSGCEYAAFMSDVEGNLEYF